MYLMFGLGRADVWPVSDYGVRAAVRNLFGMKELPTPKELESFADHWKPYRSVASWYLWRSLDNEGVAASAPGAKSSGAKVSAAAKPQNPNTRIT